MHTIPLEMWGQDCRPSQPFRKVVELRGATRKVKPKHPPPGAVLFRVAVTAESCKSRAGQGQCGRTPAGCIMAPVPSYSLTALSSEEESRPQLCGGSGSPQTRGQGPGGHLVPCPSPGSEGGAALVTLFVFPHGAVGHTK